MSGGPERSGGGGSSLGFLLRWIFCGLWEAIDDFKDSFSPKSGH